MSLQRFGWWSIVFFSNVHELRSEIVSRTCTWSCSERRRASKFPSDSKILRQLWSEGNQRTDPSSCLLQPLPVTQPCPCPWVTTGLLPVTVDFLVFCEALYEYDNKICPPSPFFPPDIFYSVSPFWCVPMSNLSMFIHCIHSCHRCQKSTI